MTTPKIKWRVDPEPTGRYRSFERRSWPFAEYPDGSIAAQIICEDPVYRDYHPATAKSGSHSPLTLLVYDYSEGIQKRKCKRAQFQPATVKEAKELLAKILLKHPHFIPVEFRTTQGVSK